MKALDAQRAQRTARDLEVLAAVARCLLETADLDEQLELTLRLGARALGADRGSVMLADASGAELVVACATGLPPDAPRRVPIDGGIAGWVVANREPLLLNGPVRDGRFSGVDATISSALSLPLASGDIVLGALNLDRTGGEPFGEADLRLAASLAALAAVAIEKSRLHAAVVSREKRVRELLGAVITAQEKERSAIAGDIHDGFLQDLSAIHLKAETAKLRMEQERPGEAVQLLEDLKAMVRDEMERLRDFILDVRPPSLDEVGLGPTLREMLERAGAAAGVQTFFRATGARNRLPRTAETVLYRVAQEAVRNVVRHAGAASLWMRLDVGEAGAALTVEDDGAGADPAGQPGRHFGIATMAQRVEDAGGSFFMGPRPEGGTLVRAVVPLGPLPRDAAAGAGV